MTLAAYVLGVGVWTHATKPPAALLPVRMRGRASLLTAMFAEVAERATRAAGVDAGSLPGVFGSAYGEMGTTLALLDQLRAAGAQLSPAKFQASVHNTAAGQLSIALKNPLFSTSLAAGHATVAMSLLEALAWLATHPGQVLLACAEEGASAVLQPEQAYSPLAAAFVLASEAPPGAALARVHAPEPSARGPSEQAAAGNPCQAALELARAVLSGERRVVAMNDPFGSGHDVQVESFARSPAPFPGVST